jgi:carbon monoxide dehydrogenase subunit G
MPTLTVSKDVTASAEAVWTLLADFADVRWIPVISDVEVEGEGPGMSRKIRGSAEADPTVETLLWIRPEQRQISYRIDGSPLPVNRFEAVVSVTESGVGGCRVAWTVDYEPSADDASARESIEAVYGMMADWLAAAANPAT